MPVGTWEIARFGPVLSEQRMDWGVADYRAASGYLDFARPENTARGMSGRAAIRLLMHSHPST